MSTFLREAGAEARIEEFGASTLTAADAADAIGCELRRIVKSLVFECDGRPVLVLVPGDRRVDTGKVAALVGAGKAKAAGGDRVAEITGYPPGGVAPFALRLPVDRVLIDRGLLLDGLLWIGAGSTRHVAGLPSRELVRVAQAEAVDVTQDG